MEALEVRSLGLTRQPEYTMEELADQGEADADMNVLGTVCEDHDGARWCCIR